MATARILVVDDEPTIAKLASAVLARQGYEVFYTTSPREALKAATDGAVIDLILSDVVMPEMSGPELIREVQQHSPATAAVLISGYIVDELPADIPLVRKPFAPAELISVVNRVLQEAEQARDAFSRARDANLDLRAKYDRLQGEFNALTRNVEKTIQRSENIAGRQRPRKRRNP